MEGRLILLFDGQCILCNGAVDFILRNDRGNRFRFASLQSAAGIRLRHSAGISERADSMVLIEDERAWIRSSAALRIAHKLGMPWAALWSFMLVPRPVRDAVYDWVAAHRQAWFGRRGSCRVLTEGQRGRFVAD